MASCFHIYLQQVYTCQTVHTVRNATYIIIRFTATKQSALNIQQHTATYGLHPPDSPHCTYSNIQQHTVYTHQTVHTIHTATYGLHPADSSHCTYCNIQQHTVYTHQTVHTVHTATYGLHPPDSPHCTYSHQANSFNVL